MQRQYVLLCLYYCYMIIIFVNVNTHVCLFLIKRVVITCMVFTVCWPVVTVATVNNVITWQEHVPKATYKDMTVTNVTLVIHFFFIFFFFCNLCLLFVSVLVVIINCFFFLFRVKDNVCHGKGSIGYSILWTSDTTNSQCDVQCVVPHQVSI